jgi:hypothetical protein
VLVWTVDASVAKRRKQSRIKMIRPVTECPRSCRNGADRYDVDIASLGDRRSGGVETVGEWLAQHLPVSLQELTDAVVSFPRPESFETSPDVFEDLTDYLRQHHLAELATAASALGRPVGALERCSREHPQQFVLLSGPPAVVFELVAESGEEESEQ